MLLYIILTVDINPLTFFLNPLRGPKPVITRLYSLSQINTLFNFLKLGTNSILLNKKVHLLAPILNNVQTFCSIESRKTVK